MNKFFHFSSAEQAAPAGATHPPRTGQSNLSPPTHHYTSDTRLTTTITPHPMRHPQLTSSILQGIRFEFPSVDVVQLLHVLRDLLLQTDNIFTLLQDPSLSPAAVSTTQLCITTIIHNTKTVLYQIQTLLPTSLSNNTDQCTHLVIDLMQSVKYLHTKLWAQLSFPHATQYRKHIYIILLIAQQTLLHIAPYTNPAPLKARRFSKPDRTSQPSIADQVVHRPLQIIDPYIIALQSNYYYPISADSSNMPEDENEIDMIQVRPSSPPKDGKPPAQTPVTVEHSVEAISDVLREMEADDPPNPVRSLYYPKDSSSQVILLSPSICHV